MAQLIDYYQVWDEPNLADAWGGLDPRPAEYTALLSTARAAILSADPAATIVAAALAPTTETAGRNISDIRYLEALYALGAGELMDVVAGKPYGFSSPPLDRQGRRVGPELFADYRAARGNGSKRRWPKAAVGEQLRLERAGG